MDHEYNNYDYRHHWIKQMYYFHLLHVMDNNVRLKNNQRFSFLIIIENILPSVKHTSHVVDKHSQGPNEQESSCSKKRQTRLFIILSIFESNLINLKNNRDLFVY
jgi:hypothetical protein